MTKWICDRKECGCAPCRCEIQGSFEPAYCILKDDKTYPKWEMYDTETKYEHIERRPEQKLETELPDWVEIGCYVYCPRNGYGKITSGSVKSCHIEFDGGADDFTAESIAQLFLQARLRPYNAEEMKALVGKVIESKNKVDCLLVTAYNSGTELDDVASVMTLGEWVNAEDLLRVGYTIDGHPCAALEHLENGEWVK